MVRLSGFAALVWLGGCTTLLGIAEPSPGASDASSDASAGDAAPIDADTEGTVTIRLRGADGVVTSTPGGILCPPDCDETFAVGQEVLLHATVPDFRQFGGFRGGACVSGTGDCTFEVTGDVEVSAGFFFAVNLMFVTSQTRTPGSFDGIAAADAFCQAQAEAGGLPGTYLAWLSTTAMSARQRLAGREGWIRPDLQQFVASMTTLGDGKILYPPSLDEHGRPLTDDLPVATDTLASGLAAAGSHCSDYKSEADPGLLLSGEPTGGTVRWTQGGAGVRCNQAAHYYCFGNDFIAATFQMRPEGPVMWLSRATLAPGFTVAGADALCESENAAQAEPFAGGFVRALVADGEPVAQRFADFGFPDDKLRRPDGVDVAASMDALLGGAPFSAAPNVTVDALDYLDVDVWTGGTSFDSLAFDCAGWTATGSVTGTTRPAASTRVETMARNLPCSQSLRVWCVVSQAFQR